MQEEIAKNKSRKKELCRVDEYEGVNVNLGQIPCVFEFTVYKFKMEPEIENKEESEASAVRRADKNKPTADQTEQCSQAKGANDTTGNGLTNDQFEGANDNTSISGNEEMTGGVEGAPDDHNDENFRQTFMELLETLPPPP